MDKSSKQRRWTRAKQAAAATALALLLVACADATDGDGKPPGKAEPKPSTTAPLKTVGKAPARIPSADRLPGWSHSLGFAADGSGFALLADCPEDESPGKCRQFVAVLDKGAKAWRQGRSPLPAVGNDSGISSNLVVLGPGRALIAEGLSSPRGDRTWFTRDGGRTWKTGTSTATGTTSEVPKGGTLVTDCLKPGRDGNGCVRSRLVMITPGSGEYRVLAEQPPLKGMLQPAEHPTGNVLLVTGKDPESARPAAVVSHDRGRSWTKTRLRGTSEHTWGFVLAEGKDTLYAAERGQLPRTAPQVKNGLLSIHASNDDGRTWTRVWRYRQGKDDGLNSLLGAPVAAHDGSLTVYGEEGIWRSTDGARTFTRTSPVREPAGYMTTTPLGYLWSDSFGNGSYRISADGIRWHEFTLGASG
ncbi:exo-alpha-sialidase [Streptomyces sp. NBC_01304]|uniref:exo-alpha-sialidase n=1 Tax=Streptomyces sp. NBC_01304 TaxID=2903818 RepID=UPI002E162E88|nr:exo-alpha-sialidase [Streptomyces sp. NBC_01304]